MSLNIFLVFYIVSNIIPETYKTYINTIMYFLMKNYLLVIHNLIHQLMILNSRVDISN